jgi:hypothetical protein
VSKDRAALTTWMYFSELWGTPDGQIYYKLPNWYGFYKVVPNIKQVPGDKVNEVPSDAFLLLKDGEWLNAPVPRT